MSSLDPVRQARETAANQNLLFIFDVIVILVMF